jgi:hypothetical protein
MVFERFLLLDVSRDFLGNSIPNRVEISLISVGTFIYLPPHFEICKFSFGRAWPGGCGIRLTHGEIHMLILQSWYYNPLDLWYQSHWGRLILSLANGQYYVLDVLIRESISHTPIMQVCRLRNQVLHSTRCSCPQGEIYGRFAHLM